MAHEIYLDHNATTPPRPEVCEVVARAVRDLWGNPSSVHGRGRTARHAVETARHHVAALVGAATEEIVFTSGGTEADNLGVRGLALGSDAAARREVVSSPLEHPAVLGAIAELKREGFSVAWVAVDGQGRITPDVLAAKMTLSTKMVALALVNHEIGNVYSIRDLADVAHARGALFHCDVVQAVGRMAVDLKGLDVDSAALSGHKLGAPPGVGALYVRRGVAVHPLVAGGHQERERRAGTENVPGIVGLGEACRLAGAELTTTGARSLALRQRLEERLLAIAGARLHGDPYVRSVGTVNVGFEGAEGQRVLAGLDLEGVRVSVGSACTSGSVSPSPVLLALGLSPQQAREAVRFSLGRQTSASDVDTAAELCAAVVARVRAAAARA